MFRLIRSKRGAAIVVAGFLVTYFVLDLAAVLVGKAI
jgi:hypothetical protein